MSNRKRTLIIIAIILLYILILSSFYFALIFLSFSDFTSLVLEDNALISRSLALLQGQVLVMCAL